MAALEWKSHLSVIEFVYCITCMHINVTSLKSVGKFMRTDFRSLVLEEDFRRSFVFVIFLGQETAELMFLVTFLFKGNGQCLVC